MKFFRVIAADDHGESIFKAKRLGDFKMEAIGVELLDAIVDSARSALWTRSVPPRLVFRMTGMPVLASMCCARSSASTTCSVKNFEPIVILVCGDLLHAEKKQMKLRR